MWQGLHTLKCKFLILFSTGNLFFPMQPLVHPLTFPEMIHRIRDVSDVAMDWDPAIAIPTLVGSLLSLVASTVVIICWLVFGGERRSFRYALILNLTVAGMVPTKTCSAQIERQAHSV